MKYSVRSFVDDFFRFYDCVFNSSYQFSTPGVPQRVGWLENMVFMSGSYTPNTGGSKNKGSHPHKRGRVLRINDHGEIKTVKLNRDKEKGETAAGCVMRMLGVNKTRAAKLLKRNH